MPVVTSGTTTSAAMTLQQNTVPLTSGTNVAQGCLLVVDLEAMTVMSVNAPYSSTNPFVLRGVAGTEQATHISGAPVVVQQAGSQIPNSNYVELGNFANRTAARQSFASTAASGRYIDCGFGPVTAWTSYGTDTAIVATTTYIVDCWVRRSRLLTGAAILNGSVAGNGNGTVILYDKDGNVLITSASTATASGNENKFQLIPFSSPYFALGQTQYFVGYQGSSTSDKIRTITTGSQTFELTASVTGGTYGVTPAITPPTTFTSVVGPFAYLY